MTDRDGSPQFGTWAHGFTLIEVVVAIALLAVVIGPICGSLLALTSRATALSSETEVVIGANTADDAWKWSVAEIDHAKWEGTKLNVEVRAAPGADPIEMGWWVDGWYTGSIEDTRNGSISVDPPEGGWPSGARWLTVRSRRGPNPWGVPWRMELPAAAAEAGGGSATAPAGLLTIEPMDSASSVLVLHHPGAAAPDVRLGSNSAPAIELSPEGATTLVLSAGSLDVYCDGALQSLTLENGDVIHLYF